MRKAAPACPTCSLSSRSTTRAGAWLVDTWQVHPRVSLQGGLRFDHSGLKGEGAAVAAGCRLTTGLDARTRLRVAAGRYTQSPGYEKTVQSDYVLDLTSDAAGPLRSEQAVQVSAGLERSLGRGFELRLDGYVKRFTDVLIGQLESEAERQARIARYDFPADLAVEHPHRSAHHDGADQRRPRAPPTAWTCWCRGRPPTADARLRGWASYTWGRAERDAYGRRYAFEYDRRHAFAMVAALQLTRRWELAATTRVASGFPRTAPVGRACGRRRGRRRSRRRRRDRRVPALPRSAGRLVYAVDFGGVANLNGARLPLFARVDVRATWRPGGPSSRWELYVEVINVLNRQNAGALDPRLEYDPTADQPKIVEVRDQAIPLLPTLGIRFRF